MYRFLKQRGLTARQLLAPPARKKFEAEFSNQLWQSDMLFGPYVQRAGGGRIQAFLYAILDDASRLIPHAQFYLQQGLDAFLDCLRQAVAARGVPIRLYVDNAKVYRSLQLARIAASIGILITHTPPYQPEGRGKKARRFAARTCRCCVSTSGVAPESGSRSSSGVGASVTGGIAVEVTRAGFKALSVNSEG